MDRLAAGLLLAAAVLTVPIAWTGDAGPFGAVAALPLLLLVLAVPVAATSVALRLLRRRPPGTGAPRLLASGAAAAVLVVVAVPVGERVRRWQDERAAQAVVRDLDAAARTCARDAVAAVPDEAEANPGVAIRPRLRTAFEDCLLRFDPTLGCTPGGCTTTLVDLEDASRPTVVVEQGSYLDAELRRRTGERYDRTGRWRPQDPEGRGTVLLARGD